MNGPNGTDTIVFIHGLYLTARSWELWEKRYTDLGYKVINQSWPGLEIEVEVLRQDASLHIASLEPGVEVTHPIGEGRGVHIYLIDGAGTFDDQDVKTGDAAKVAGRSELRIRASDPSELILVDVPMQFEPVGIWKGRIQVLVDHIRRDRRSNCEGEDHELRISRFPRPSPR